MPSNQKGHVLDPHTLSLCQRQVSRKRDKRGEGTVTEIMVSKKMKTVKYCATTHIRNDHTRNDEASSSDLDRNVS
jgi:hypothetical protein